MKMEKICLKLMGKFYSTQVCIKLATGIFIIPIPLSKLCQ